MWGCVVAEIFWTLFVSRDSHSTIPNTGFIGYYFQATAVQVKRSVHRHCSASHFSGTCLHCKKMTGKQHCLVPRCWPWVGASRGTFLLPKGFPMSGSSWSNFQAIQGLSLVRNAFKLKCSTQLSTSPQVSWKRGFHSLQKTAEHFLLPKTQRYSGKECERTVGVVESSRKGVYWGYFLTNCATESCYWNLHSAWNWPTLRPSRS